MIPSGRPSALIALWEGQVAAIAVMTFDASTLFVVIVTTALANAVLLVWSWLQNRRERVLISVAIGYLAAAAGNVLLVARGSVPAFVSVDIANSLLILSMCMVWVAARTFNGGRVPFLVPFAGIAVWLLAMRVPAIGENYELRIVVTAVISAFYCLIGAREMWVRDRLRTRIPIAILVVIHAMAVLVRIPVALSSDGLQQQFQGAWFGPLALEALVFVQVIALLVLSLTKERAEVRLEEAAMTDPLTGLANRRAFFEHGARLIAQAARSERPTALVAFDLDRFKQVNDTYGHPFGDAVLEAFAAAAKTGLRAGDLAGRIGGEEFVAILPGAAEGEARSAAKRVIDLFADTVGIAETDKLRFTLSAGLVVSPASQESIEALFIAADKALYEAKYSGGDQLRIASPSFA